MFDLDAFREHLLYNFSYFDAYREKRGDTKTKRTILYGMLQNVDDGLNLLNKCLCSYQAGELEAGCIAWMKHFTYLYKSENSD